MSYLRDFRFNHGDDNAPVVTAVDTTITTISSFDAAEYRAIKYMVTVSNETTHQVSEVLCIHDNVTATQTEYAIVSSAPLPMGIVSATLNDGVIDIQYTGTVAANTVTAEVISRVDNVPTGFSVGLTPVTVSSVSGVLYRSAKFLVTVANGVDYQVSEVVCLHNGTTAYSTEYAEITSSGSLGSATVVYNAGAMELQWTGLSVGNIVTVEIVKLTRA